MKSDNAFYGPARIIRSNTIPKYRNLEPLFSWKGAGAYLIIDRVRYNHQSGAVLCYHNPPVHQIGTTALCAFHEGVDMVLKEKDGLEFLLLCGSNAPVHSGGDLKESLRNLKKSLAKKRELEAVGAPEEAVDALFTWGESRLEKGVLLYRKLRYARRYMRVVGVCGGGIRFGGSAEIPLMADYLIGDSRSGMCFSESLIGIIPGWGGITRVLVKAGLTNAAYMAKTARPVFAHDLKAIGIYNDVVEIPFPIPEKEKKGDPAWNRKTYLKALEAHDDQTGELLLPKGFACATCPEEEIPSLSTGERKNLSEERDVEKEVWQRANPDNYAHLWGKPLKEVDQELKLLGKPLAPQSIHAIDHLLKAYDVATFEEQTFIEAELRADAALYRDARFLEGLSALLEQRVPNFRHPDEFAL